MAPHVDYELQLLIRDHGTAVELPRQGHWMASHEVLTPEEIDAEKARVLQEAIAALNVELGKVLHGAEDEGPPGAETHPEGAETHPEE